MDTVPIIKEDGAKQRIDVGLTPEVAKTLGEMVLAGTPLYPRGKGLEIVIREGETEKTLVLAKGQVNAWVTRGNVIPGTNQTLRSYLDERREEKRVVDEQARQTAIRENAEKQLQALSALPIKAKEVTRFYKYNEAGVRVLTREQEVVGSAKMAEVIVKGLQFGLERLNPQRYGAKVEQMHTHLIFDLSQLREARKVREALKREGEIVPA